jgi:hypothetical protein
LGNILISTKVGTFDLNGTEFIRFEFAQPSATLRTESRNFIEIDDSVGIIGVEGFNAEND